jgi:hypothetical protein
MSISLVAIAAGVARVGGIVTVARHVH